jgi:hypothetical protein
VNDEVVEGWVLVRAANREEAIEREPRKQEGVSLVQPDRLAPDVIEAESQRQQRQSNRSARPEVRERYASQAERSVHRLRAARWVSDAFCHRTSLPAVPGFPVDDGTRDYPE